MYKYYMIIDGTEYNALFTSHMEAADFIDANDADGSEVVVLKYEPVAPKEILDDKDFEESYKIEMVATYLMPNRHFEKWTHAEAALKAEYFTLFE